MKLILKSAIAHITGSTLFDTAFPPSDSQESREHYREILIKCADYLENKELLDRFKKDDDIIVASARVVRTLFLYSTNLLIIHYEAKWAGFKHSNSS
jgi:hypothetical protein